MFTIEYRRVGEKGNKPIQAAIYIHQTNDTYLNGGSKKKSKGQIFDITQI